MILSHGKCHGPWPMVMVMAMEWCVLMVSPHGECPWSGDDHGGDDGERCHGNHGDA